MRGRPSASRPIPGDPVTSRHGSQHTPHQASHRPRGRRDPGRLLPRPRPRLCRVGRLHGDRRLRRTGRPGQLRVRHAKGVRHAGIGPLPEAAPPHHPVGDGRVQIPLRDADVHRAAVDSASDGLPGRGHRGLLRSAWRGGERAPPALQVANRGDLATLPAHPKHAPSGQAAEFVFPPRPREADEAQAGRRGYARAPAHECRGRVPERREAGLQDGPGRRQVDRGYVRPPVPVCRGLGHAPGSNRAAGDERLCGLEARRLLRASQRCGRDVGVAPVLQSQAREDRAFRVCGRTGDLRP